MTSTETDTREAGAGFPLGMLYAAVWLVFLVPVGVGVYTVGETVGVRVFGYAMLAAFILVYMTLMSRWMPAVESNAGPSNGQLVGAVALLMAIMGLTGIAAGSFVIGMTPYLTALAAFCLSPRDGIPVGVVLWLGPSFLAAAIWGLPSWWLVGGPGVGVLFIVVIRMTEHYEERQRRDEEQLRQAQERSAIARDVHDVLGHSLTVLSIKAQLAGRLIDDDPVRAKEELAQIDTLARESLSQVRSTVTRLRTPQLETEVEAVRTALEAAGVEFELKAEKDPAEIDDDDRLLAWTLREAVTNVLRHAGAERCRVELGPGRISITDDGVGLPEETEGAAGHGLRGLRERARAARAQVEAGPGEDGIGTRIEVRL